MELSPPNHSWPAKRGWNLLCALLILGMLLPLTAAADAGLDKYNLAAGLYKKNRWSLAAATFRKFLKAYPKHVKVPYARLYLGLVLVNLEKYSESRDVLRTFVKDYPNNRNLTDAMYRVAECSYLLDDLKAAETEFTAFLKKAPKDPLLEWAVPYLADAQLRQNNATSAAANFKKSLTLHPKGKMAEDSKFGLARSFEALKRFPQAIELYQQLASNPLGARAPQAQLNLAGRYFENGDFGKAAATYVELEERFPESTLVPLARLNAGYSSYQAGDYRDAIKQFNLAEKTKKQSVSANYWKGLSHKALAEYPQSVAVFKATFEANDTDPLAVNLLFHWADSELRRREFKASQQLFLDLVKRWPQSQFADDSLYFAAEAALQRAGNSDEKNKAQQLMTAADLLQRFRREFPNSGLKMYQQLLQGRVQDAHGQLLEAQGDKAGGRKQYETAVKQFQDVLENSTIERTKSQARFFQARTRQKMGDHAGAIDVLTPLVDKVKKDGADSEFADALVLFGNSLLNEKKYDSASQAMQQYLTLLPDGEQAAQAISTMAASAAHQGKMDAAQTQLDALLNKYSTDSLAPRTTHQLAEIAYSAEDWEHSAKWFATLVELSKGSPDHPVALSGLAWSQSKQRKFSEAAVTFAVLSKQYAKHELAPEAAFKTGESLQQADRLEDAVLAYSVAVKEFGGTWEAYSSAKESARLLKELKKSKEADTAYAMAHAELLKQPKEKQKNLDRLFDEWALLNYEAKNYSRADEIFRMLVTETPDSKLVGSARFSLAESDLIAGKLEQASKTFRELEASAKSDNGLQQDSLFRLIGIAVEKKDWADVEKTGEQLRKRFPEGRYRWDAPFFVAQAQLHLDKLKPANATLLELKNEYDNKSVNQAEWYPHVWILLAESFVRLKKYDDVLATADAFQKWDADSPLLYKFDEIVGRSYKNQSKFVEARRSFKKVIESKNGARTETAAKSQLFLAETFYLQKNYQAALPEYFKVYFLYKFPELQAGALLQAGVCEEFLGNWTNAVKTYESLLKEFPKTDSATDAKPRLVVARKKTADG